MAVENRGPQVQATAILFLTLSWLFIVMRCYVRIVMIKQFGTDDWLAVAALVLFTLYCTFVLMGVQYGTGQHLSNLPAANVPIALKWWWCCELAYVSSTAVLKISIGVFLARICIHKAQRIAIWVVVAGMSAFSIFYFFIIVFQCRPVIWFWTQYTGVGSGSCVNASVIADSTYAHSAVSAVCDFTLGTLPLFLVWNLNMNPRTKVSVAFILALGAVGSVATIVRIPYINQLTETSDFLYTTTDVAIWSTVEPGIGITAAAMATLRPLFRTFLSRSKLLGSTSNKYAKYGGPSQAWPQSSRKGYMKNGSGPDNSATVELGLRSDIGKHSGVTTVIKSQHDKKSLEDIRSPRKLEKPHGNRIGGDQMSQWNNSESRLKDDDSSEDAVHMGWEVRKTTEVTTQEDTASDIGSKPAKMWS